MSIIDATTCGFLKVAVYSALTEESLLPALVKGPGEKRNEFVSRIIKQQLEFIQTKFSVEIKYQTSYRSLGKLCMGSRILFNRSN